MSKMSQIQVIPNPVIVMMAGVESAARPAGQPLIAPARLCLMNARLTRAFDQAVHKTGARVVTVQSAAELSVAVDTYFPVLILMGFPIAEDGLTAIRRCKLRPHSAAIPIYIFGNLPAEAAVQFAQAAGADQVWAEEQFVAGIATLIAQCVNPPIVYPAGWNEPLPQLARLGVEEFNRGDYFEQHELLEAAWMAEVRPIRRLYQGILQIGVAFLQIERHNWAGAIKMMRRGLPKLRGLPPVCQGIGLAAFRQVAEEIHVELMQLGAAKVAEFDQTRFPQIVFDTPSATPVDCQA